MRKDTKAMITMVTGTFIIGIGSELITPFSLILGSLVGLFGCAMFLFGAFFMLKSMFKSMPEIITLTKEAIKKKNKQKIIPNKGIW